MSDEKEWGRFDFPDTGEQEAEPKELELTGRMGWPEAVKSIVEDLSFAAVVISLIGLVYLLAK